MVASRRRDVLASLPLPLRGPRQSDGAEQRPLHLVHIRAREFNPGGQAVHVPQKGPRVALHTLCLAAAIGDDLP